MNSDSPNTADIVERLHARHEYGDFAGELCNPAGPEAAAIIAELRADRDKWKQRAFDLECQHGDLQGVYVALKDHRKAQA